MNFDGAFLEAIKIIVPSENILLNEPLAKHTTFKIGGPADIFINVSSTQEVSQIIKLCEENQVNLHVLGNGSNILVLDKGIRGVLVKFGHNFAKMKFENNRFIVGAGALLKDVANFAAQNGHSGIEFAVGIPGSIGGAVFMNAGAYEGEMSKVVESVTAINQAGEIIKYQNSEVDFSYRHSIFQDNHHIICEVTLNLGADNQTEITEKMNDFTTRRESKQPLDMPSAGSTFKRPVGYFAGTLIEQAGLKGFKVGGAMVSPKHAGFVINAGGATAQDVLDLIKEIQRIVYENHGVNLQPEVKTMGE